MTFDFLLNNGALCALHFYTKFEARIPLRNYGTFPLCASCSLMTLALTFFNVKYVESVTPETSSQCLASILGFLKVFLN